MKEFIKKYKIDIIVILILFIVSLGSYLLIKFLPRNNINIAYIYIKNELKEKIDLDEEIDLRYITYEGKYGEVKVELVGKTIKIIESSCPNKDCIKQKEASPTNPLICAYNEVLIEIKGNGNTDTTIG